MNKQKKLIIIGIIACVVVAIGVFFLLKKDKAPKAIYEVAVMVRDQNNSNLAEDRKTSLKQGDVLVVQKDGHHWSKTELISYLILRIKMTEEQSQMLTRAKTRELADEELTEVERGRIEEEKKRAQEAGEEYVPEKHEETLLAREYRINMSNLPDFKPVDLIKEQPFIGEVYDWGIVEKKQ